MEKQFVAAINHFTNNKMMLRNLGTNDNPRYGYFRSHVEDILHDRPNFEDSFKVRVQGTCAIQAVMSAINNSHSKLAKDIQLYCSSKEYQNDLLYHTEIEEANQILDADCINDINALMEDFNHE